MDSAGSLRTPRRVQVSQQVSHSQSTPHAHRERETGKGPTLGTPAAVVTREIVSSSCVVSSVGSPPIGSSGTFATGRPADPYTTSVTTGRLAATRPAPPFATPLPGSQLGNAGLPGQPSRMRPLRVANHLVPRAAGNCTTPDGRDGHGVQFAHWERSDVSTRLGRTHSLPRDDSRQILWDEGAHHGEDSASAL
jgi:hypothetical protein